ncbi:hypothetical protein NPX99_05535 [Bartonella sp. 220]|nr:hypothetical protein [Bartonella sp. 220B]
MTSLKDHIVYFNRTIAQSHNRTIAQSHNRTIAQSHNRTIAQSHNRTNLCVDRVWISFSSP